MRLRRLYLIFAILFVGKAEAQLSCESLFQTSSNHLILIDPAISRGAIASKEEQIYLKNVSEYLEIFSWWLKSSDDISFDQIIKKMHFTAAQGAGVSPRFYITSDYNTSEIFPGLNRFEILKRKDGLSRKELSEVSRGFLFTLSSDNSRYFPSLVQSKLMEEALVSWYKNLNFKELKQGDVVQLYFDFLKINFVIDIKIESVSAKKEVHISWENPISGFKYKKVSADIDSGLKNYGQLGPVRKIEGKYSLINTVKHEVPSPESINQYISHGQKLMNQIKTLMKQRSQFRGADLNQIDSLILNQLSDYYQIMINAHPFVRINHSLFMNQVNFILNQLGRNNLSHTEMDWLAMALDSQQFRKLFHENAKIQ